MDKLKQILATVAPVLAASLGTPAAGVAVGALCKVFGLGAGATPEQMSGAVLAATPEQLKALADAEIAHVEYLKALAQFAETDRQDRAGAREAEGVELAKGYAWTAALSALVRPLWGVGCFALIAYYGATGQAIDPTLSGIVDTVLLYFFGSRLAEKLAPTIAGVIGDGVLKK